MIQCDDQIAQLVSLTGMIEPFEPQQVRDKVISYGLSSFGYDCRCGEEFRVIRPFPLEPEEYPGLDWTLKSITSDNLFVQPWQVLDPKEVDPRFYQPAFLQEDSKGKFIVLAPHSYCLSSSVEYFRIPPNTTVICVGKSTYARSGLVVNVTPLESGWEGQVTLEFANCTPVPIRVYANEGICQLKFMCGLSPRTTYASRHSGQGGKYQHQTGITLPRA